MAKMCFRRGSSGAGAELVEIFDGAVVVPAHANVITIHEVEVRAQVLHGGGVADGMVDRKYSWSNVFRCFSICILIMAVSTARLRRMRQRAAAISSTNSYSRSVSGWNRSIQDSRRVSHFFSHSPSRTMVLPARPCFVRFAGSRFASGGDRAFGEAAVAS